MRAHHIGTGRGIQTWPQQRLYFLPEPQGQRSLRPILVRRASWDWGRLARSCAIFFSSRIARGISAAASSSRSSMSAAGSKVSSLPASMKPTNGAMMTCVRSSAASACRSGGGQRHRPPEPADPSLDPVVRRLALGGLECRAVVADTLGLEAAQAPVDPRAERIEHDADRTEHRLDLCGIVEDRLVGPQTRHPSAGPDHARRDDAPRSDRHRARAATSRAPAPPAMPGRPATLTRPRLPLYRPSSTASSIMRLPRRRVRAGRSRARQFQGSNSRSAFTFVRPTMR